jgi:Spy/CpxP family protein refolding chaperone
MMLFRTVLCLLSIVPISLISNALGSFIDPSPVLALNISSEKLKAANKDNEEVFAKLGLSPNQIRKVRAIYDQYEPEIVSRRQAIIAAKNEVNFQQPVSSDNFQQKKINQLRQELMSIKKQYASALQSVLTSEQWSKLQQLRKERHE